MGLLIFMLGLLVGSVITLLRVRVITLGTMKILDSDDGPYLFAELNEDIDILRNKTHAIMKIDSSHN